MAPRDFSQANRVGLVGAARTFSNVVSPPTIFAVFGLVLSLSIRPTLAGLFWGVFYGVWVSLIPILFVLLLLYGGWIEELHMSNTRERILPYVVTVLCSLIAVWFESQYRAPQLLVCLTAFNAIQLTALAVVTVFWLVSMHAAAAMSVTVLIGMIWGWLWALLIGVPLIVSIVWVRLFLRRHTVAQVLGGLMLGGAAVLLATPLGCFV